MDTKKLRQKILDLAIRGKLVPQDPNDEPASVLLERIRAEKKRLIKEGKIKRGRKSADSPQYENEIPDGWICCRFDELCSKFSTGPFGSMVHKSDYVPNGGIPIVNPMNIVSGIIVKDNLMMVSDEKAQELNRYRLSKDDILIARRGDLKKCAIVTESEVDWLCGTGSFFLHIPFVEPRYIELFYLSEYVQTILARECVGATMDNLNQGVLGSIPFLLPPQNEQRRIIREVAKWFALIGSIEENQKELYQSISFTKTKILDLAIHGKLVPQDSNDEPAFELLKQINSKFEPYDNSNAPILPTFWQICKVKDVFQINPKINTLDDLDAAFVPMTNIEDGYNNRFTFEIRRWGQIKRGYTHFRDGDIAVAKISPCLENRKSVVLKDMPNGIGAGTTELNVFRSEIVNPLYGLYFFKSNHFISNCVGTFNGVVGQQRVATKIIEDITFFLPPYNEQLRIVNKIEELFAVLDEIKESLEA